MRIYDRELFVNTEFEWDYDDYYSHLPIDRVGGCIIVTEGIIRGNIKLSRSDVKGFYDWYSYNGFWSA